MTTKNLATRSSWALFIGIALTLSCTASGLGPECAAYLGDNGCCLKAAAGDAALINACQELAAQYASYPSRDQAEANCKQAAATQCSGLVAGQPSSECTRYLACVAAASPAGFPGALAAYGPASPCWSSDTTAPTCTAACVQAMNTQRQTTPDIAACEACTTSTDCWSARPICDAASKSCVACGKDADCPGALCVQSQCAPGCRISGTPVDPDTANPANSCQSCQPAKSTSAWSDSPVGTQCAFGSVCSGGCRPGCYIAGTFRSPGAFDPSSTCRQCNPGVLTSDWSNLADGASCGTGMSCLGGKCGGPKFTLQTSGSTAALQAIWGSSSTNVFAAGSGGVILHTSNGTTWTTQISGTISSIDWLWGSGSTDVYAMGDVGTLLHTIDSGTTWTKLTPIAGSLAVVNMWGSAKTDVYAVVQGLGIYRSTNSGVTWTHQTTATANLWAVWGSSRTDVYAVGAGGVILHTTDSGTTWVQQSSGVSSILYSVWGSGKNDVFAMGENGVLLSSTDSGVTWTQQGSASSTLFWSGLSRSSKEHYAVGAPNTLLYNAGTTTWSRLSPGTTADLYAIWGNSTDIFVAGASGTILHSF